MLPDDIYHSHLLVYKNGKLSRHPAGRFMIQDGQLHHLEDYYHGLQASKIPEGAVDDYTVNCINNCGPHLSVASHSDIANGLRHDFIPEHPLEQALPTAQQAVTPAPLPHIEVKPPSVWHYHRAGHDKPHLLEAREGTYMLDGSVLADDEIKTILDNVRTKAATLRYTQKQGVAVAKMEQLFTDLKKADTDMDPQEALAHLASLGGDEKSSSAVAALRRHIFTDPMTGLGNQYAHSQWLKQARPGVHLAIDANNFKQINDTYGHAAGDAALKAFGQAFRDSMNEVAPPGENGGSIHRTGGDEFQAHLPTHDHAAQFARSLREKLAAVPPIGGTHRLSVSIGAGHDPLTADQALYEAKKQKLSPTGLHKPHTIPHVLYHSVVPGHEGPMAHAPEAPPALPAVPAAGAA